MPAPQATDTPPGELERYEVQLLLAQIHGFVHESVRRVDKWCPETAMVTRDDIGIQMQHRMAQMRLVIDIGNSSRHVVLTHL